MTPITTVSTSAIRTGRPTHRQKGNHGQGSHRVDTIESAIKTLHELETRICAVQDKSGVVNEKSRDADGGGGGGGIHANNAIIDGVGVDDIDVVDDDAVSASKRTSTVFVVFKDMADAAILHGAVLHGAPAVMSEKHAFVEPRDVIWRNCSVGYMQRQIRNTLGMSCVYAIVIFWAVISKLVHFF